MGEVRVGGFRLVVVLALGVLLTIAVAPWADAKEAPEVHVRIRASGVVSVARDSKALATTSLKARTREEQAKALSTVQRALKTLMKDPALREPAGSSRLRMRIEADAAVRWEYIAWIMQVGAHPDIGIWRITLKRGGDAAQTNVELPRDTGMLVPGAVREFHKVKLKFFRKNKSVPTEAFTRMRMGNSRKNTFDFPRTALPEDEYTRLYDQILVGVGAVLDRRRAVIPAKEPVVVEIMNAPPDGGAVPFGDVFAMLELVQSKGFKEILFEGAAAPGTGTHLHDTFEAKPDATAPVITTVVGSDGRVYVRDLEGRNLEGFLLGADKDAEGLTKFIDTLAAALHRPADRNRDGSSRFVLRLDVKGAVPWKHVQWLMQGAAHPRNKIYKLDLRLDAPGEMAPLRVDLPLDRGLADPIAQAEPDAKVKVRLFRKDIGTPKAWTKIRIDALAKGQELPVFELRGDGPGAANMKRSDVLTALTQMLGAHHRKTPNATVEIIAPPPFGGAVPFADVREVVMIAKAQGFTSLVFEGTAPPSMNRRK